MLLEQSTMEKLSGSMHVNWSTDTPLQTTNSDEKLRWGEDYASNNIATHF